MGLRVTSVQIINQQSNQSYSYDLNKEVNASQSEAIILLQSILNFSPPANTSALVSQTELELESNNILEKIVIEKTYSMGIIKIKINDAESNINIFQYLTEKLKLSIDQNTWNSRFVDFRQSIINTKEEFLKLIETKDNLIPINSSLNIQKENIVQEIVSLKTEAYRDIKPEDLEKIDRLREVKVEIEENEKAINNYQSKKDDVENLNSEIKKNEQLIDNLSEKLKSVQALIETKKRINNELSKVGSVNNLEALKSLKQQKAQELNNKLSKVYTNPTRKGSGLAGEESQKKSRFNFAGHELIILIFTQIVLSFTLSFLSTEGKYLFFGIIPTILLGALVWLINMFKTEKEEMASHFSQEEPQVQSVINNDFSNSNDFINAAWANAYSYELSKVENLIKQNLNDKSYEEVLNEKNTLEQSLAELKNKQKLNEKNNMSSEEYYKKRRELDILKIEKENLEFNLKTPLSPMETQLVEQEKKFREISDLIDEAEYFRSTLPLITINSNDTVKNILANMNLEKQIILINNK